MPSRPLLSFGIECDIQLAYQGLFSFVNELESYKSVRPSENQSYLSRHKHDGIGVGRIRMFPLGVHDKTFKCQKYCRFDGLRHQLLQLGGGEYSVCCILPLHLTPLISRISTTTAKKYTAVHLLPPPALKRRLHIFILLFIETKMQDG